MAQDIDWRRDPMVRLEKRLYPLQMRVLRHIPPSEGKDEGLAAELTTTARALHDVQRRYFDAHKITISKTVIGLLEKLGTRFGALANGFGSTVPLPADHSRWVHAEMADQIEEILDAVRGEFLGAVLSRQDGARRQSEIAMREINSISRQIYFISINASVEAARAGDAGRGFSVIGEQIRALSEEATKSLKRMKDANAIGG